MAQKRRLLFAAAFCALWAGCNGCINMGFGPIHFEVDSGTSGCGHDVQACNRVDEVVPHGHIAQRWWIGGCMAWCDDGFFDCNGDLDDGCESAEACSNAPTPPPQAIVFETPLPGAPEGLALCDGVTVVLADGHLSAMLGVTGPLIPIATAISPAGGIACNDFTAYYGQLGGVIVASGSKILEGGAPDLLAAGDPARGVLVDTSNVVYWRAASDGGALLMRSETDGATSVVAAIDPSTVDLPFALGPDGPYVVSGGGLARIDDAGATSLITDAGVVAVAAGDARVSVATLDDAGVAVRDFDLDAGLGDAQLTGDVRAVVASGSDVFVATSEEIWRLPSGGSAQQLVKNQNDIADLAVDATWVAWTSRGDQVLRAIHR